MKRVVFLLCVFLHFSPAIAVPPHVVCISGLISTGKTTLINAMEARCNEREIRLLVMRELNSDALCEIILQDQRQLISFMLGHTIQKAIDAELLASDYDLILMERCHLDQLAFVEAFEETGIVSADYLAWTKDVIQDFSIPTPGQCLYLDITADQAMERKKDRGNEYDEVFTLKFTEAHRKANFRMLREHYPKPIVLDWSDFGESIDLDRLIDQLVEGEV